MNLICIKHLPRPSRSKKGEKWLKPPPTAQGDAQTRRKQAKGWQSRPKQKPHDMRRAMYTHTNWNNRARRRTKGQLPQKWRKPCPIALPLQLLFTSIAQHQWCTHIHGTLTNPIAPHQLRRFSPFTAHRQVCVCVCVCTHKRRWHGITAHTSHLKKNCKAADPL